MGVEQDGLGCFEVVSVFYEIEPVRRLGGCFTEFAQGNTRGSQERPLDLRAVQRCFIPMELDRRARYLRAGCMDIGRAGIHEQQNGGHKGWEPARKFRRPSCTDVPGAGRIHHKAHRVYARCCCCFDVFVAGQTTNLDAASFGKNIHSVDYGNQSKAGVRVGNP